MPEQRNRKLKSTNCHFNLDSDNLLDKFPQVTKIQGMDKIELPDVTITIGRNGQVKIVHRKTGLVTESTVKKINSWAVSQLRNELVIKRQTATA